MAALTFKQIQDMALEDAFPETKRSDVKVWIVDAHTEIWDAASYTFKDVAPVTVNVVDGVISGVTDIADVYAVYDPYGEPLAAAYDPKQFYDVYNSAAAGTGSSAEAYAVVGNSVVVKPSQSGTVAGFQITYRKVKPSLSNDGDLSGLPDGYDMALVYGAKSIGFTLINNPFADDFTNKFAAKKQQLKDAYTYGIEEAGVQIPAYRWFG
jgi:hypothetical protein